MTVLDVFGWAMAAAPYTPAFAVLGALTAAVYAAHHTTRAWRERRAEREARRIDQHPLVCRYHDGPDALQELALLDEHLTTYDQHIRALYRTGEHQ
ncbi:hypothetical protein [Streptomyces sp. NPDC051994]|uniref:hypothetical protein n=1 Tax=unclassified Streptomyces TaxID=2593676 RepID=UPI00344A5FC1